MENAGPIIMLLFACCGWPMLFGVAGYGIAKGWFRSPINARAIREDRHPGEEF